MNSPDSLTAPLIVLLILLLGVLWVMDRVWTRIERDLRERREDDEP